MSNALDVMDFNSRTIVNRDAMIRDMQSDIKTMQSDIKTLQSDVKMLDYKVEVLDTKIDSVRAEVKEVRAELRNDITRLETKVDGNHKGVTRLLITILLALVGLIGSTIVPAIISALSNT